jgi:putative transposase
MINLLDAEYTEYPFYGVRKMKKFLCESGYAVGFDHTRTLLRKMGLVAVFAKPNLSKPHPEHRIYPYLLRDVEIMRPNQVWSTDITYIKLRHGFAYLTAIIDWHSRYVLSWRLSNSLESDFCVEALEEAISNYGCPEIFNTDQGTQFTSEDFIRSLTVPGRNISISMDGKGRAHDNIFVERLWRSVKYEDIYIRGYQDIPEAREGLRKYFEFYNMKRYHQSLDDETPWHVYSGGSGTAAARAQVA